MEQYKEFFEKHFIKLIYTGVVILVSISIVLFFRFIISRFLKRKRHHNRRAITMAKLLNSITQYTVLILGILAVLSVWGIDIKPFLAGAGILGLALGFGAQDLVKDIVSGFFIIIDNYYDVGDIIDIRGFKGEVIEIGLKSTRVVNWKGELKVFSNRDINEVINFSKRDSTAVVNFRIRYNEDLDQINKLCYLALDNIQEEFPQIITGPQIVGVVALEENGVVIRITAKTRSEEHYPVERGINRRIREMFVKNNIPIAINQILIKHEEGTKTEYEKL